MLGAQSVADRGDTGQKIRIRYRDEQSRETQRTIWPTIIGYAETVRLLAALGRATTGFPPFQDGSHRLRRIPPATVWIAT